MFKKFSWVDQSTPQTAQDTPPQIHASIINTNSARLSAWVSHYLLHGGDVYPMIWTDLALPGIRFASTCIDRLNRRGQHRTGTPRSRDGEKTEMQKRLDLEREHAVRDGVLDAIGQTPLVRFRRYLESRNTELLVKLESGNPGGSAKDRPAKKMVEVAMQRGQLRPGMTVVESTSGNMGIGLAQVCRYHGLRLVCVVDPRAQSQNLDIIRALGGKIDLVKEPLSGDFLAARISRVQQLLEETPNSYWPNQYANQFNPRAHLEGTIREIDDALEGDFDYVFVATSSTGTAQGCRDYLHQLNRRAEVVAVDAVGSVLFGGSPGQRMIPGLGAGKLPELAKRQNFSHIVRVTDLDCVVGCRRAAATEAMLVGGSAGGVLESVRRFDGDLEGKRCVAILHDSGTRYLNTVFNDSWVENELDGAPQRLARLINEPSEAATETAALVRSYLPHRILPLHQVNRGAQRGSPLSVAGLAGCIAWRPCHAPSRRQTQGKDSKLSFSSRRIIRARATFTIPRSPSTCE